MLEEKAVSIPVEDFTLEGLASGDDTTTGLVMCHPHPLFSGTMQNKVVTTVIRTAADLGWGTLRFNFRGTGKSGGVHDHGVGEQEDVAAAVAYAREVLGWKRVILAGFSFGAGLACLCASANPELLNGLVLIAPAVHHFDAPTTLPVQFESWVFMGDADEVVPFDEVDSWVQLVVPQPHWVVFEDTGHFFHGRLTDLKATLLEELATLR
ncbi:MAG: alpha/beta fold hydrolase [Thalassolituus sp.]